MTTETVITIRTERTPNPNSLKYNVGKVLIPGGSANFPTAESAGRSPLAKRMYSVAGVTGVFIGSDFITITKEEGLEWSAINAGLGPQLEQFFEGAEPVLDAVQHAPHVKEIGSETADPELVKNIKQVLDEKVRPAVMQDGGDITYRGIENGIVYLEMQGSCSGCPSSSATLKSGIENMLKHYFPDAIQEVRAI